MSSPPDDAASGAYKYLSTFSSVTALLGAFPSSDPVAANRGLPYIFSQPTGIDPVVTGPLVDLEGTGQIALVLADLGGWGSPAPGSSMRFKRLAVEIWADALRDGDNNITETPGATVRRAQQCFDQVQVVLHRQEAGAAIFWGDLVTVGCALLTEPQFYAVPDGDGLIRGPAYYGVTVAGHQQGGGPSGGPGGGGNVFMPLSGGAFTGAVAPAVVQLTDAPVILVDASAGNVMQVTLGGNRTLGAPANPAAGQVLRLEITQDGTGGRTLAFASAYEWGSDVMAPSLSATPGDTDVLLFAYDSGIGKWMGLAVARGYA